MTKTKTMKHIKLNNNIQYPVGMNMQYNLPIIQNMADLIKKKYKKKDIILWTRGSSGAIIGGIIASIIPIKAINYVRKPGEISHSKKIYNTNKNVIHIIVDDFIDTGDTITSIWEEARKTNKVQALCVTGNVIEKFANKFNIVFTGYIVKPTEDLKKLS